MVGEKGANTVDVDVTRTATCVAVARLAPAVNLYLGPSSAYGAVSHLDFLARLSLNYQKNLHTTSFILS